MEIALVASLAGYVRCGFGTSFSTAVFAVPMRPFAGRTFHGKRNAIGTGGMVLQTLLRAACFTRPCILSPLCDATGKLGGSAVSKRPL